MNPVLGFTAVLCIAVGAGACGAINMWYDRDIDALMRRTRNRPIPAGRMPPGAALAYGVTLAVFSVAVMFLAANATAAGALALSIFFYVFVYTIWLKRRTPQNIVIGGAAGAFPPLIGWAAVTGSTGLLPWLMFAIILLWTPPHFWSLSLFASDDYARAGVPMLPVVRGARHTRWNVLIYSIVLLPVSLLPWALGCAGPIYGLAALVLGMGLIVTGWRVLRDRQDAAGISLSRDAPAKAAFRYSLLYLFVLFLALAVDHFVG
ncbi:MAG: heme o synthase [Acetobacteraceae bacterium]